MADATLASARARLAEAKAIFKQVAHSGDALDLDPYTKNQLYENKVADALYMAKEALVSFRRAGHSEKKVEALKTVVEANLATENSFDALLAAQDELAMIKRTKDKKAEAEAQQLVAEVLVHRYEGSGALSAAAELLALQRELGNRAGEAKALSLRGHAKLLVGKIDAATDAEEALKIFRELGDKQGEAEALRTVNLIYVEKGQADKAPSRPHALQALQELAFAAEARDKGAWEAAFKALNQTAAYTQRDVEDALISVLNKDRKGISSFLQEQGMNNTSVATTAQYTITEIPKRLTYVYFRMGGLGYGPRFRCLDARRGVVTNAPETAISLGHLKVYEDADDWEKELQYHPGILDGALQVGSALTH